MRSALYDLHVQSGAHMAEVDGWEMPDVYSSVDAEYAAAYTGAVIRDASSRGRLRLTGSTRLDFLHRMSTNDMNALQPGQGAATVLTTPIGRIVDRIVVYVRDEDLVVLTSSGAQALVLNWLKKYIFFNDDVQIRDAATEYSLLSVYGKTAARVASQLAGRDVAGLQLHEWLAAPDQILVARADPIAGGGYHLLLPNPDLVPSLWHAAVEAGAVPIGEQAFEILRVESGLPRIGHELSEAYIPLEVGLWPDVSFTKGCYIGQEIIARMESRQRLAKQLVGLRSLDRLKIGAELAAGDGPVGKVSSVASLPAGEYIGLGFVKPSHAFAGTRLLQVGDDRVGVEVASLPISPRVFDHL